MVEGCTEGYIAWPRLITQSVMNDNTQNPIAPSRNTPSRLPGMLSEKRVRELIAAGQPGKFKDSPNLFLQVAPGGSASWVFRFKTKAHPNGRNMGLGSAALVSPSQAREAAHVLRGELKISGRDPLAARDIEAAAQRQRAAEHDETQDGGIPPSKRKTFATCMTEYIEANKAGWKNAKHAEQWTTTMTTYAPPTIGEMHVHAINTAEVMSVLQPLWTIKNETASRLRSRMELILARATVMGHRKGENQARWRGHLDNLPPPQTKVQTVEHHEALPYAQMPAFMTEVRKKTGMGALRLEFLILTATRTAEALHATWDDPGRDG